MRKTKNPVQAAIDQLSRKVVAKQCSVSTEAVRKWYVRGRLPRTEYTGETGYADKISAALNDEISRSDLLKIQRPA